MRNWRDILPEEPRPGKGESLWRGVAAAKGDIVVFVDADLESAAPGMVTALAAPFADPAVEMVKARYRRSLNLQGSSNSPTSASCVAGTTGMHHHISPLHCLR